MREIKFRAWNRNGARMSYSKDWCINDQPFNNFDEFFNDNSDNVFMQYTGLKDKNGVEIYEGDIVRYKWQCDMFDRGGERIFLVELDNRQYLSFGGCLAAKCSDDLIVIGNMYENPELLGKCE